MQTDQFDAVPQYSSRTILIVTIFFLGLGALVSYGLYFWQRGLSNQEQTTQIEDQPVLMQDTTDLIESPDEVNLNPMEAPFKQVSDPANLFVMEIPESWQVVRSQGSQGVQISYLAIESPNFKTHTDPDFEGPFEPIYYDQGASLIIHVTKGSEGSIHAGDILELKKISVDGQQASWTRFVEPSTFNGELLDVNVNYKGNNYLLRMGYNPETDPYGAEVFDRIVASLKFE